MGQQIKTNNTFNGGLVTDFHELSFPNHACSDVLNMEIITSGEDQNIFQNIKGDLEVVDLGEHVSGGITYKYVPLGVKIHNNIAYIVAGAFAQDGTFKMGTIGTFPSPNWEDLNDPDNGMSRLDEVFRPFHNFKKATSRGVASSYTQPFESIRFAFERNKFIDIVIQPIYDRSVNVIFTDDIFPVRIINSRFRATDNPAIYKLADLIAAIDSNQYDDDDWDRIELVQTANFNLKVTSMVVSPGGALIGGGYRYFFKYVTAEKNNTDIIYESPFFPISQKNLGISKSEESDKQVTFTIQNIDTSYSGIELYFAHTDGITEATLEIFKINFIYTINKETTNMVITHTGRESVTPVAIDDLNSPYTPIKSAATIDIIQDRLALANVESNIDEADFTVLEEAAKSMTIWERRTSIEKDYSDPNMVIQKLGYWPGEVYEFGVMFEMKGSGISPVFPLTGMDNFADEQDAINNNEYPAFTIDNSTGFSKTGLFNHKGLFRMSNTGDIYEPINGSSLRHVRYLSIYVAHLSTNTELTALVQRFSIVKRKRRKNVMLQGMICPTLKIPSSRLGVSPLANGQFLEMPFSHRWIGYAYNQITRLGLNYFDMPMQQYNFGSGIFGSENTDIDINLFPKTSFIPQPSVFVSLTTALRAWTIYGNISQTGDETDYVFENNIKSGQVSSTPNILPSQSLAFYSAELDLNGPNIAEKLTGVDFGIEIQDGLRLNPLFQKGLSPFASFSGEIMVKYNSGHSMWNRTIGEEKESASLVLNILETISYDRALFKQYDGQITKGSLVSSGAVISAADAFTGSVSRNIGFIAGSNKSAIDSPLHVHKDYTSSDNIAPFSLGINSKVNTAENGDPYVHGGEPRSSNDDFKPLALMCNSFSTYIGIELDLIGSEDEAISFLYGVPWMRNLPIYLDNGVKPAHLTGILNYSQFAENGTANVGHLAHIFNSSSGRWSQSVIVDLYKQDTNAPYFAVTDLTNILVSSGNPPKHVIFFRGDAYISNIFKRVAYKNGITGVDAVSESDVGIFGVGIAQSIKNDFNRENFLESEKIDEGLNLYDTEQILELVSYSNINADIRSTERVSNEETAVYGYDRDFYPHKKSLSSDDRADSTGYNKGYTGDLNPLPYFRIEEGLQFIASVFPNRIMLTEKNRSDTVLNSFRALRGANSRDYGAEYGPIIKIVSLKTILLSIHPVGILSIGVDERTLIAEGTDIFVDTAAALNPIPVIISDVIGSTQAESIVKTDYTVYGVDYNASAIWMFLGDKIKIISEFVIKSLLDNYKKQLETGDFSTGRERVGESGASRTADTVDPKTYTPRVYSIYNREKHNIVFSYVAEDVETKKQFTVGTVVYNTVEQKWISRLTKGIKFSYSLSSDEYINGVTAPHKIWKADALVDPISGKNIRNKQQGQNVPCEFEIIVNEYPTFEKILENIQLVCNKNIPDTVVYTMVGDYNQAADEIWGEEGSGNEAPNQAISFKHNSLERVVEQPLVTRVNGSRQSILLQNAYYKNNNLYIEVGKVSPSIKDNDNKRIRDKAIRVRFIYTGSDALFIQNIISVLSLSSS